MAWHGKSCSFQERKQKQRKIGSHRANDDTTLGRKMFFKKQNFWYQTWNTSKLKLFKLAEIIDNTIEDNRGKKNFIFNRQKCVPHENSMWKLTNSKRNSRALSIKIC